MGTKQMMMIRVKRMKRRRKLRSAGLTKIENANSEMNAKRNILNIVHNGLNMGNVQIVGAS